MTLQSRRSLTEKLDAISELVADVDEETYYHFSHGLPQSNLGMIDDKSASLTIDVAGDRYEVRQSPGLLTSSNAEGTTGAALWKISPVVAEWLADQSNTLWSHGILGPEMTIVELGCGITGLIGLVMARRVATYILTDQRSVMKPLQDNIHANAPTTKQCKIKGRNAKKQSSNGPPATHLHILELNWETDDTSTLNSLLEEEGGGGIDLIVVCDCVFNDFLLEPLVKTCAALCSKSKGKETAILIAQQLRSDEVFSAFLDILLKKFRVWRVLDSYLPSSLQTGSGFAVHIAKPV